jgi:hypothetical protein
LTIDDDAFETETDVAVCMDVPGALFPPDVPPTTLTADGGPVEGGEGGGIYAGMLCELDDVWLMGLGAVVEDDPVSLLIAPAIFLDIPMVMIALPLVMNGTASGYGSVGL